MTINLTDESTKTVLLAMAGQLEQSASNNKVDHRRNAKLATARKLRELAKSRAVYQLLDYLEYVKGE